MKVLNLTQHAGTPEQGVHEPADKRLVQQLITFDELPSATEIADRARSLAALAKASGYEAAMIGGAPFFMGPLERALKSTGVKALYAFSRREAEDVKQPDGSVKKTQVFRHVGFVEA